MKQQEETVTVSATFYFKTNEIIRTKMTAPMIDGIIAILAITGPPNPRRYSPRAEPIRSVMILPIQPIEPRRFVSQPAIAPIAASIIRTQIKYNL